MDWNQPYREGQVALTGTQLERYHEQMQRYQRLLYRFSDGALPVMIRFSTLAGSNDPRMQGVNNMSNAAASSKEATIEALTLLQDKVAADIETLKRKTTENCEPSSAIAAVERGRQNSNVVGQESKRPAPLPSQANILPPINTRPPNLSLQVPSLGVSTKKGPRKVPPSSPVNENTPVKRTLDSAFEVHSVLPQDPIANEKDSASCGTHDSCKDTFHDSGTQCGSESDGENEWKSTSESTECEGNSTECDDSDYVEEERVKSEQMLHNGAAMVPSSTSAEPLSPKVKRQCVPVERYTPTKIILVKEEGVYRSSHKRVKEEGAERRADQISYKDLRYYFGKMWKREDGIGIHLDKDVFLNPRGVVYRIKNSPKLGEDFFLSAHDAFEYCLRNNWEPINPLPVASDSAPAATPIPEITGHENADDNVFQINFGSSSLCSGDEI